NGVDVGWSDPPRISGCDLVAKEGRGGGASRIGSSIFWGRERENRMIVIFGGGLAGLRTAYHLSDISYRLYETGQGDGGLWRSYHKDGFTFDYTGHLLHFRQPEIKALIEQLLAGKLQRHTRRSFIFSHRTYTEYPFQVNTYGLPPEVVRECLMGFIATLTTPT